MAEAANRRLTRAITFIALIGAGYYWMVGGEYTRADLVRLEEEIESRKAEMTARNDELASIRAWADSLVSNAWAIERVARERYGFVRPQEILVRFVDLGDRGDPASATPPQVNVP
ncbi:FtsB family cell division protein [Candidatus Palauibacter sp.]|uniref:FtsB family cell division protein n=1 Tax=Candidatus Palauibacter sp. TaxID=3101350 RepID=UPI003B01BF4A